MPFKRWFSLRLDRDLGLHPSAICPHDSQQLFAPISLMQATQASKSCSRCTSTFQIYQRSLLGITRRMSYLDALQLILQMHMGKRLGDIYSPSPLHTTAQKLPVSFDNSIHYQGFDVLLQISFSTTIALHQSPVSKPLLQRKPTCYSSCIAET